MNRSYSKRAATCLPLAALLAACASPQPPAGDARPGDVLGADATSTDVTTGIDAPPGTDAPAGSDVQRPDMGPPDSGVAVIPSAHPRIYLNATQRARLTGLLSSSDPAAVRFREMVDRQLTSGNVYAFSAWFAALMFQLTGEGRYADYAVSMIDRQVTAEEMLIARGMRAEVAGDSYLEVGDRIGDLALVYDWCFDRLTATQRERWLRYANQAVWNVWHHETAQWGGATHPWSGWSVDNPSNNYYYSFLRATMLLGLAEWTEDPAAADWITMFRTTKIGGQLLPTFARDLAGGGSREGTGYGVAQAQLFRLYDLWQQSTTERLADLTPHARESLAFMIHEIVPTLDRVAPIGDHARDSTGALFDYHRDYVQVLTALYPSEPIARYGRYTADNSSVARMSQGFMYYSDFLYANPAVTAQAPDALSPVYYGSGTGNVFFRSAWRRDAVWGHFIAGPYTESHAHQDQGSFMIYRNEWLAYDQNTLSHSGIEQSVLMHNLVRVESGGMPVGQRESAMPGRMLALQDRPAYLYMAADLSGVYDGRAAVQHVDRELVYLRDDVFVVFDRVRSSAGTQRVFQLNTPINPSVAGRVVTMRGAMSTLALHTVLPAAAPIRVVDWAMTNSEMSGGYRVDVSDGAGTGTVFLNVLSVDGGATAVEGADMGTQRGVRITLRGGGTATVRFGESAAGGTIELRGSDGAVRAMEALPTGVATLPLER